MKHMRWPHTEDQSAFTDFNFAKFVKFTHDYCHRRKQKYKVPPVINNQQPANLHQITDEHLIDTERIRLGIQKEIDRKVTDFPKDRL